jgi:hypothetical protein
VRGVNMNIAKSLVFLDIGGPLLCKATAQSAHCSAMCNKFVEQAFLLPCWLLRDFGVRENNTAPETRAVYVT